MGALPEAVNHGQIDLVVLDTPATPPLLVQRAMAYAKVATRGGGEEVWHAVDARTRSGAMVAHAGD